MPAGAFDDVGNAAENAVGVRRQVKKAPGPGGLDEDGLVVLRGVGFFQGAVHGRLGAEADRRRGELIDRLAPGLDFFFIHVGHVLLVHVEEVAQNDVGRKGGDGLGQDYIGVVAVEDLLLAGNLARLGRGQDFHHRFSLEAVVRFEEADVQADGLGPGVGDGLDEGGHLVARPGPAALLVQAALVHRDDDDLPRTHGYGSPDLEEGVLGLEFDGLQEAETINVCPQDQTGQGQTYEQGNDNLFQFHLAASLAQ